jgi:hypothetical protein
MSTPVRGPAGPLSYAPRWARSPASIDAHADRESTAEAMPAHDEIAEPPWRRDKSHAIFEGDIAIKELRERLALAPDQIPEPMPARPRGAVFGAVARLLGVMVLAAGGALAFLWKAAPREASSEGQTAIAGEALGQAAASQTLDADGAAPVADAVRERADGSGPTPAALLPMWAAVRDWYRKAAELGAADAPARIAQLAQVGR